MINILSCIGMTMQSEVCLWTILGLVRSIFDATLFKMNANLKQVWQMSMPEELTMSMQRLLRTVISGVMLVQCFTVYVYLASYIVLLYPVFLEERPTLVLPWLLLAAIRQLLCELTSLAVGLGTCVLLGPARPPCIKFVIVKLISITPSFYMWMLLFSYYHALKVVAAFKTLNPALLQSKDHDYGLELAIRRRRTKSLLGEDQLRSELVASLYGDRPCNGEANNPRPIVAASSRLIQLPSKSLEDIKNAEVLQPLPLVTNQISETGSCEEWLSKEVVVPRDTDRILEQFVLMMLRIGAYKNNEGEEILKSPGLSCEPSAPTFPKIDTMSADVADTPPLVGSSKGNTASYLREYPQIFMRRSIDIPRSDNKLSTITLQRRVESEDHGNVIRSKKRAVTISSKERISLEVDKIVSRRKFTPGDKNKEQNSENPNEERTSKSESDNKKRKFEKIQDSLCYNNSLDSVISSKLPIEQANLKLNKKKNETKEESSISDKDKSLSNSLSANTISSNEQNNSTRSKKNANLSSNKKQGRNN